MLFLCVCLCVSMYCMYMCACITSRSIGTAFHQIRTIHIVTVYISYSQFWPLSVHWMSPPRTVNNWLINSGWSCQPTWKWSNLENTGLHTRFQAEIFFQRYPERPRIKPGTWWTMAVTLTLCYLLSVLIFMGGKVGCCNPKSSEGHPVRKKFFSLFSWVALQPFRQRPLQILLFQKLVKREHWIWSTQIMCNAADILRFRLLALHKQTF